MSNYRFTDRQKKQIIADYAECRSYAAVARKYKCSDHTVKSIVTSNPDFAAICEQKAEDNRKDIIEYMSHQSDRVCRFIDRFLSRLDSEELDKIELDKAAKVFGIVFDKFCRPAQDINLNSSEGIKVTIADELGEWSK